MRNNQQPDDAATTRAAGIGRLEDRAGRARRQARIDRRRARSPSCRRSNTRWCCSARATAASLFADRRPRSRARPGDAAAWATCGSPACRWRSCLEQSAVEDQADGAKFLTAEGRDEPPAGRAGFRAQHSARRGAGEVVPGAAAERRSRCRRFTAGRCGWSRPATTARCTSNGSAGCASKTAKAITPARFRTTARRATPITPGKPFTSTLRQQRTELADEAQVRRALARGRGELAAGRDRRPGRGVQRRRDADRHRCWSRPTRDAPGKAPNCEVPESPYAWYRWQTHASSSPSGKQQIWARAVDALGRSQPARRRDRLEPAGLHLERRGKDRRHGPVAERWSAEVLALRQLFGDPQQLVVLGQPFAAGDRADLDRVGGRGHGQVGDRGVFGLAAAGRNDVAIAGLPRQRDRRRAFR